MRMRGGAWCAAVLTLLALVVPATALAGCAGSNGARTGTTGTWTTYALPSFSAGSEEVTAHAADVTDDERWWATNGMAVSRSTDGGCSWREVLVLPEVPTPDVPASRTTDRIRTLAAAAGRLVASVELASTTPRAPVVVNGEQPALGQSTLVLTGTDDLRAAAPLTSPVGVPGPAAVAPSDPRTIYAVAGGVVHASSDAGASWRVATPPNTLLTFATGDSGSFSSDGSLLPGVTRLVVDPLDPQTLWARARGQVFLSEDGGRSYDVLIDTLASTFPVLAVQHSPGTPPRVTLAEQERHDSPLLGLRTAADGRDFAPRPAAALGLPPGLAQSGVAGPVLYDVVLTTSDPTGRAAGVFFLLQPPFDRMVQVDEFRLAPLLDVQLSGTSYVFRAASRLARWEPDRAGLLGLEPEPPPLDVGVIPPGVPPLSAETVLSSPVQEVRLPPGSSTTVPLRLDLSPEPTPLDVFFLLDTSGSMDDVVRGLAAGFADLARELGRQRIDAHFGLGDYQDWNQVRYRRLTDIGPPGEDLRRALESITTAGGAEPAYTALHQMATGSGIAAPSTGDPVPVGQQASWRPGSLRMVVHATDETVSDGDPDGPEQDEVLEVLSRERIRHVGIEVVRPIVQEASELEREVLGPGQLFDELAEISAATGSLAPPGGVDCEGDGEVELAEGAPLVCGLFPGGDQVELAGPLQRVLSTIVDLQPVRVDVGPPEEAQALQAQLQLPPEAAQVDVKEPAQLDFALTLTCDSVVGGSSRVLSLRPQVGLRTGTPLPLRVVCEGPVVAAAPTDLVPAVPPAAPAVLAVALPPPPPPPPVPANALAPAGAPAGAPAAVVNPVPGVAVAPADQEVELVLARQEAERAADQLAMVDRRPRPDAAAARLLAMALVCAAATAVAVRRREAARLVQQR